MAWEIERTDEFTEWWDTLDAGAQESAAVIVGLLAERGPELPRPYADTLKDSNLPNLKELRVQHGGRPYRILYVFDPCQTAILLLGGRKGAKGWYRRAIRDAERLYREYLAQLRKEGLL